MRPLHYIESGIGWAGNRSPRRWWIVAIAVDRQRRDETWRPLTYWVLQLGPIDVAFTLPALSRRTLIDGRRGRVWRLRTR